MQPLVRQIAPDLPIFAKWNECPAYAAYAALSGLPLLHGTTPDRVPGRDAYLRAEPERAAAWRGRVASFGPKSHRKIGLVWAGRPTHSNDRNRSVRLNRLRPVLNVPGVTFVSLQKGRGLDEAGSYYGRAPLVNLGASMNDFADTAAVIDALDLVITVDTSVGHLAGAMGKPCWIMLPFAPDWRWLLQRTDTPWYPSVRLFRQRAPDGWEALADEVAGKLNTGDVLF
jgi:hypothetical protein